MWISLYFSIVLLLSLSYASIMAIYFLGWKKLPVFNSIFSDKTAFISVIIPARNEENFITDCLNSILKNQYPKDKFEVIVIDDFSTDDTKNCVKNLSSDNVRLYALSDEKLDLVKINSYKKKAIEIGIKYAQGELILTTDADCLVPKNWLTLINSAYQIHSPKMIAAPVVFHHEKNALERFQSLDFVGLMGITAAGIGGGWQRMANGANLCFTRQIFEEIGGYAGIDGLASGDDMLLMQKIAQRHPDGIFFLKNEAATVRTEAKPDWPSFFSQRLRWASKSAIYPEWRVTLVLSTVFLFCWNLLISACLWPFFGWKMGGLFIFQLLVKAVADFIFLKTMARFFRRSDLMRSFWSSFFLHIFYIVAVGTASQFFKKFEWKGRRVS